jgi:uncharacterized membrane-anchored protein YitT (DUF2179 family)
MSAIKENKTHLYKNITLCVLGSFILALGLCHIHSQSLVTEGGALGLVLLFEKWWKISPALSGFVLNLACYIFAIKTFGKKFLFYSAIACGGFSLFYAIFECFNPLFPHLKEYPILAAVLGALFVGVGVGLCLIAGGAPSGDDALVMSLSKIFKVDIRWVYLFFDIVVLALSLTYIPLSRILYSLLTVFLSGQIIGIMLKLAKKEEK